MQWSSSFSKNKPISRWEENSSHNSGSGLTTPSSVFFQPYLLSFCLTSWAWGNGVSFHPLPQYIAWWVWVRDLKLENLGSNLDSKIYLLSTLEHVICFCLSFLIYKIEIPLLLSGSCYEGERENSYNARIYQFLEHNKYRKIMLAIIKAPSFYG